MDFCADTIHSSGYCSTDSEAMNKPFFTKESFSKESIFFGNVVFFRERV
jgi:hypothetical protein